MATIKKYVNAAAIVADKDNLIVPYIAIAEDTGIVYTNELPRLTNTVTYYNKFDPIYLVYTETVNNNIQYEIIQPDPSGTTTIDLDAYTAHGRIACALPGPIGSWIDISNAKYYKNGINIFRNGVEGGVFDITGVDTSEVNDFWLACQAGKYTTLKGIEDIDVRKASRFYYMFANSALTSLDLNKWRPFNLTDCMYMFYNTPNLRTISMDDMLVSKPLKTGHMFDGCGVESLGPLNYTFGHTNNYTIPYPYTTSFWYGTRLMYCTFMFANTPNLKYCNINGFDVSLAGSSGLSNMFANSGIEEIIISGSYPLSRSSCYVQTIDHIFSGCSKLAYLQFSFHMDSCKSIDGWLNGCTSLTEIVLPKYFFTSPNLNTYDFSGAVNWVDHDNILALLNTLPTLDSGSGKFIKFSDNTKAVINADTNMLAILSTKNWTMQ